MDLKGVRDIRIASYTLAGARRTEIVARTVEIEREDGIEEHTIEFPEPHSLGSFQALVELLNRKLREA